MSDTQAVQQLAYMVRVVLSYYVPWWALLALFLCLMALFWKYEIANRQQADEEGTCPDE